MPFFLFFLNGASHKITFTIPFSNRKYANKLNISSNLKINGNYESKEFKEGPARISLTEIFNYSCPQLHL